jgi:hypothetical protein
MASWRDVRRIALALPGAVEERSSSGTLRWTVNDKNFAWERPLRRADRDALGDDAPTGPILAVHSGDLEMKDVWLAGDPEIFFTTPHFEGYPAVLLRLTKISTKQLKEIVAEAWLSRAPKRAAAAFLQNK